MYFLYSLLLTAGFALLLPRFLIDALRHGKYAAGLRERFAAAPVRGEFTVVIPAASGPMD